MWYALGWVIGIGSSWLLQYKKAVSYPKWFFQGTCIDYLILTELQQKALLKLKYDSKQAESGVEKNTSCKFILGHCLCGATLISNIVHKFNKHLFRPLFPSILESYLLKNPVTGLCSGFKSKDILLCPLKLENIIWDSTVPIFSCKKFSLYIEKKILSITKP